MSRIFRAVARDSVPLDQIILAAVVLRVYDQIPTFSGGL